MIQEPQKKFNWAWFGDCNIAKIVNYLNEHPEKEFVQIVPKVSSNAFGNSSTGYMLIFKEIENQENGN